MTGEMSKFDTDFAHIMLISIECCEKSGNARLTIWRDNFSSENFRSC